MKRILLVILFVCLVLIVLSSTVLAGGDQNTGGTGNGKGLQATNENGCSSQPCFSTNADQPEYQYFGEP